MVKQQGKIRTILGLCARDCGHHLMYELLSKEVEVFNNNRFSWEELIHQAENQGVAPLLYKHVSAIDFTLPDGQHRILRSLYQRSRLANQIRNRVVTDILKAFQKHHIEILLIKGIALSNTIYESPGLRPMRDIDLLVSEQNLEAACTILEQQDFVQESEHDIPEDYYHLPPMHKSVNGLPINIEIHHNLLPPDQSYPMWSYESFHHCTCTFRIDSVDAATLNLEDNLHYLYLHGFKAPLTYEPYRLIHVADLVSLIETCFEQIDWSSVKNDFPNALNILSRLHFITPWQEHIIHELELDISQAPQNPGLPYRGWPLFKIYETSPAQMPPLIKDTFLPSQWWRQIYYGHIDGFSYYKMCWIEHPRTIWRWIKTYVRAKFRSS